MMGSPGLLSAEREKHLRLIAGVPDGVEVDLALVRLPDDALIFPSPGEDLTRPRDARSLTKEFVRRASKIGFLRLRFHDLRGTHETLLLDAGVPVHVVAARCGPGDLASHLCPPDQEGRYQRRRGHRRPVQERAWIGATA